METDQQRHVHNEDEQTLDSIAMNIDDLLEFLRDTQKVSVTHFDQPTVVSVRF